MPMASAVSSPMRMSRGLRGASFSSSTARASWGFSNDGTRRSMMPIRRIPAKKLAAQMSEALRAPHSAASVVSACRSSSTNET